MAHRASHPNRLPFEGILTRLGISSDKAPSGARGHCTIFSSEAAEAAIESLIGMAVSFKSSWGGHNARQKCGVITEAEITNDAMRVRGYLYDKDFPEVAAEIRKGNLGMSYEIDNAHIRDMNAEVWVIYLCTFTGAAILRRDKAAYQSTSIWIVE